MLVHPHTFPTEPGDILDLSELEEPFPVTIAPSPPDLPDIIVPIKLLPVDPPDIIVDKPILKPVDILAQRRQRRALTQQLEGMGSDGRKELKIHVAL